MVAVDCHLDWYTNKYKWKIEEYIAYIIILSDGSRLWRKRYTMYFSPIYDTTEAMRAAHHADITLQRKEGKKGEDTVYYTVIIIIIVVVVSKRRHTD